ncbi:MAG: gas vesicle protein [Deltaproteobacteria bacterium]|nr:gas vesicle protein [Deltaproteobacteria bacterium]
MAQLSLGEAEHVTLVDLVDRILNKGAVISGEVTISVADIDLIELSLQLVLGSTGALFLRGGRGRLTKEG